MRGPGDDLRTAPHQEEDEPSCEQARQEEKRRAPPPHVPYEPQAQQRQGVDVEKTLHEHDPQRGIRGQMVIAPDPDGLGHLTGLGWDHVVDGQPRQGGAEGRAERERRSVHPGEPHAHDGIGREGDGRREEHGGQGKTAQDIPQLPQGYAPEGMEQAEKRDAVFQDSGDKTVHTRVRFPFMYAG